MWCMYTGKLHCDLHLQAAHIHTCLLGFVTWLHTLTLKFSIAAAAAAAAVGTQTLTLPDLLTHE